MHDQNNVILMSDFVNVSLKNTRRNSSTIWRWQSRIIRKDPRRLSEEYSGKACEFNPPEVAVCIYIPFLNHFQVIYMYMIKVQCTGRFLPRSRRRQSNVEWIESFLTTTMRVFKYDKVIQSLVKLKVPRPLSVDIWCILSNVATSRDLSAGNKFALRNPSDLTWAALRLPIFVFIAPSTAVYLSNCLFV